MKVRDLIPILERRGWRLRGTRGSHRQFKHPDHKDVVTISGKPNEDLPIGTLRAILKAAGIEPREIVQ
jgi:predicted RNA binding protein YcfA (HicA-like mRNA interferase family)